ncbi:tRNA dihydrouridine synthase DusB [Candidatus Woesearchaeota archaeon]|nr:tRNA dihydrouridine synthase DusB [Candidatus Woesearchaeota archaeon]
MKSFPKLCNPFILAPMSGVTDAAFRSLCKDYGAGLTVTEFVSANALVRGNNRTDFMVQRAPNEKPFAIQIFGNDISALVNAAQKVQDMCDIIDINLGCPAFKVIRQGSGSALLDEPDKIKEIIRSLKKVLKIPLTVKIRSGTCTGRINAVEIARLCEQEGVSMITVHPRTADAGYKDKSDWQVIKDVKQSVKIPVCGNGDIRTPEDAKEMLDRTGCDYVMIGRAAMTDPLIFRQCIEYLKSGKYKPSLEKDRFKVIQDYISRAKKLEIGFVQVKHHLLSLTKGIVGGARIRENLIQIKGFEELETFLRDVMREM